MGERLQCQPMSTRARSLGATVMLALASGACAGRFNDDVWRPFGDRSYLTAAGAMIHDSTWLFAIIESFHLMGLALLGGAILLVDLRLLGLGLREESATKLARDAQPVLIGSLVLMLISGTLLYLSEATKFYSEGFWDSAEFPFVYKMLFLCLATAFTFSIRRKVLASDGAPVGPLQRRLVALTSMLLWLGVAVGGRGIGFY
jgi:hypothetical protein